jgi:hypothetical protein
MFPCFYVANFSETKDLNLAGLNNKVFVFELSYAVCPSRLNVLFLDVGSKSKCFLNLSETVFFLGKPLKEQSKCVCSNSLKLDY